jgi:HlyD family secretion protein
MPAPTSRGSHPADALPSPERLDRLVEIVHPNTWLALTCAAVLAAIALGWSIAGHVPVVIMGRGVLARAVPGDPSRAWTATVYFPQRDAGRIAPGMLIHLTPESVSRERFGSILATVTAISPDVTRKRLAVVIGSVEVAEMLMQQGPLVEVAAELMRDGSTYSGYRWSSSGGPPLHVLPGSALDARVTVKGPAPVTYLLPFLRSRSGAS